MFKQKDLIMDLMKELNKLFLLKINDKEVNISEKINILCIQK